jgi:hypothetical protein
MSLKEARKKVQKSVEFIAAHYPTNLALPELRLIQATLEYQIHLLNGGDDAPHSQAILAEASAIDTVGKGPLGID